MTQSGMKYNRLTVIDRAPDGKNWARRWNCVCECGAKKTILQAALRNGQTKSCGCLQKERTSQAVRVANRIHGESNNSKHVKVTPEYRAWSSMIQRCHNPKNASFINYGARGIRVCKKWRSSFPAFLSDVGRRPTTKHSIDRINNSKGYSPENVKWSTRTDQGRNQRSNRMIRFGGRSQPLIAWAEELNLTVYCIHNRLAAGWSVKKALTTPRQGKKANE